MDKHVDGLARAMREMAGQRDNQLREAGAIPPDRLKKLQAFLAAELPVETALFAVARQRDESLRAEQLVLPTVMHAALAEAVRSVRGAAKPLDVLRRFGGWLEPASLSGVYRAAAAVAATALIATALLHFSHSGSTPGRSSSEPPPHSIVNAEPAVFSRASLFERSANQLTLRMNRFELASLDPSLLTINRTFPDFPQPDRVLPLDLPLRQIHLDVESVGTP